MENKLKLRFSCGGLGGCPKMPSRSLRLPGVFAYRESTLSAQTLRNSKKIMLAGKRRFRYQTYGCAYFVEISRF